MPTLSFEGSVYFSTAVDRRELVVIAPSYTVDTLMNRAQTSIASADQHEINFTDIPDNKATGLLLSVSSGEISLAITDDATETATFVIPQSGMAVLMNTTITNIVIIANEDSVYDLIVTGVTPEGV